jgi:hypothetical protein
VQVTAGNTEGRYPVTFHLTTADGTALPDVVVDVIVAKPGSTVTAAPRRPTPPSAGQFRVFSIGRG